MIFPSLTKHAGFTNIKPVNTLSFIFEKDITINMALTLRRENKRDTHSYVWQNLQYINANKFLK